MLRSNVCLKAIIAGRPMPSCGVWYGGYNAVTRPIHDEKGNIRRGGVPSDVIKQYIAL